MFFQVTHFHLENWDWVVRKHPHSLDLEYLNDNLKKISNWLNSFRENWLYVFSTPSEKLEKPVQFCLAGGGECKFILYPHSGLWIHWYLRMYLVICEIRWPNHSKKEERRKLNIVKQNRMAGIFFANKFKLQRLSGVKYCWPAHTNLTIPIAASSFLKKIWLKYVW